ncbi:MAG: hypothetical protein OEW77_00835 [Gemmatimonadota bacterium]|nr:hypothetical protein [Gemmatimonadota bacterium]
MRLFLAPAAVAILALGGCYTDPNKQLDEMQKTLDLSNTLNELSSRTAELQLTLDSLRVVVAKQDSTIATLANLAGVRYVR